MSPARESPPPGFRLQQGRGAYTTHNGPYYVREDGDRFEQAFFALTRHCNGIGLVHGGMLATFMDGVLAGTVARATGATPVTVHLSIDYLHMGRAGDWVIGHGRVTRAARDIAFAEGAARVGEHDLVRASGVFRLMRRRAG